VLIIQNLELKDKLLREFNWITTAKNYRFFFQFFCFFILFKTKAWNTEFFDLLQKDTHTNRIKQKHCSVHHTHCFFIFHFYHCASWSWSTGVDHQIMDCHLTISDEQNPILWWLLAGWGRLFVSLPRTPSLLTWSIVAELNSLFQKRRSWNWLLVADWLLANHTYIHTHARAEKVDSLDLRKKSFFSFSFGMVWALTHDMGEPIYTSTVLTLGERSTCVVIICQSYWQWVWHRNHVQLCRLIPITLQKKI